MCMYVYMYVLNEMFFQCFFKLNTLWPTKEHLALFTISLTNVPVLLGYQNNRLSNDQNFQRNIKKLTY